MHERILRYFDYDHLPRRLKSVAEPFHAIAHASAARVTLGEACEVETAVVLRKLLEARDAAIRAAL